MLHHYNNVKLNEVNSKRELPFTDEANEEALHTLGTGFNEVRVSSLNVSML